MIGRLTIALLLTLACASSVQAQFGSSESRQVSTLREEMNSRFGTTNRAQFDLLNQNAALQEELAKLRGQLEVLTHEIESLRARQQDFYVDLDARILRLETGGAQLPGAGAPGAFSPGVASNPAEESAAYESALELLKNGQHTEALAAFRSFITTYPQSASQPNAHFWAGNAALQAKEVAAARDLFANLINTWPDDTMVPDAMLGLANSQMLLGERRAAQDTLAQIIARHPNSSAAQVARQRAQQ